MSNNYYKKMQPKGNKYQPEISKVNTDHSELVESEILFEQPPKDKVTGIISVSNDVEILCTSINYKDFVNVRGCICKTITYSTAKKHQVDEFNKFKKDQSEKCNDPKPISNERGHVCKPNKWDEYSFCKGLFNNEVETKQEKECSEDKKNDDNEGKDKKEGKEDKACERGYALMDGVIRQATACIPFSFDIHIPGITSQDEIECYAKFLKESLGTCVIKEEGYIVGISETDVVKCSVNIK